MFSYPRADTEKGARISAWVARTPPGLGVGFSGESEGGRGGGGGGERKGEAVVGVELVFCRRLGRRLELGGCGWVRCGGDGRSIVVIFAVDVDDLLGFMGRRGRGGREGRGGGGGRGFGEEGCDARLAFGRKRFALLR